MSTLPFKRRHSPNRVEDHSVTVNEFLLKIAHPYRSKTRRRELSQPSSRSRKQATRQFPHSLNQGYDDQFYESAANATLDARQQKNTPARRPRSRPPGSTLSFDPMTPTPHSQVSRPLRLDTPFLATFNLPTSASRLVAMRENSPIRLMSAGTLGSDNVRTRGSGRQVQSGNTRLRKSAKPAKYHPDIDGLELVSRKEHEDAFNRLKNVFNTKSPESSEYQQSLPTTAKRKTVQFSDHVEPINTPPGHHSHIHSSSQASSSPDPSTLNQTPPQQTLNDAVRTALTSSPLSLCFNDTWPKTPKALSISLNPFLNLPQRDARTPPLHSRNSRTMIDHQPSLLLSPPNCCAIL